MGLVGRAKTRPVGEAEEVRVAGKLEDDARWARLRFSRIKILTDTVTVECLQSPPTVFHLTTISFFESTILLR